MGCDFCSTCTGTVHHDYETLKDELNSYSKEEASKQDFNSWWIEGDFIYLKAFFNVSTATVNDGTSTRLYNYVNLYKHNYTTITGYRAGIWVDNSDCLTSDFWKIPPKSNLCHPEFIGWDDSGNTYTAQFTSQQVRISFACYINGKAVDGMRKTFSVKCCRVTPRVKEYYQNGAVKSIQILCDGQDIEISTAGTPYVIDTSCFKDIRKQVHANELVGTFKITLKYKYYALDFD